jgi:hypothetical protein
MHGLYNNIQEIRQYRVQTAAEDFITRYFAVKVFDLNRRG